VVARHQEAQPHEVTHQARGDHGGAKLVTDLTGASDQVLLLADPLPARREQVTPDVVGVPREPSAQLGETQIVVEHGAGGDRAQEL